MSSVGPASRDYTTSLLFGGLTRTCYVHLPPAYDGRRALPLVLALHGMGGDGPGMARLTHFNLIADQNGFVVAYPDGYRRRWSYGRMPALGGIDDASYIAALITKLTSDLCIDQGRLYVLGMSNGGGLVELLACQRAELFAAFVVVAATMGSLMAPFCRPSRPVSLLMIHGTDDPLVPFAGGGFRRRGILLSAPATAQHWARLAGCATAPVVSYLPERVNDGTRVRCEVYSGQGGAEMIFYVVENGGHTWPGGIPYLPERTIGKTSQQMDASQVIWDFFRRHLGR